MNVVIPQPPCRDNFKVISPGIVGEIGDVNMPTRIRTSNAAMFPVRFEGDPTSILAYGSVVQDGDTRDQINGGGLPARLNAYKWNVKQSTKTDVGDRWQDLRPNSRYVEPNLIGANQYDFKNTVAQIYSAKVNGDRFLPVQGVAIGYGATDMLTRGGTFPSVVAGAGGAGPPTVSQDKFGRFFATLPMAPSTLTAPVKTEDQNKGAGPLTQERNLPQDKSLNIYQQKGKCGNGGNLTCSFK